MQYLEGKSLALTETRLAQLRGLFPEIFSEGNIDFERFKDFFGENHLTKNEHYELTWAGKNEARKEIQKQTTSTLVLSGEWSGVSKNHSLIEGENLEVLRILQKSYFGKIKMIYIDPPYNTGNDSFLYPDNFAENKKNYEKRTGKTDQAGYLNEQNLWKKNTKENGQFHSVWLSMMYPRLYLSRNLLTENGVIFISIDDHEAANLKLLCDEIFGEENFVSQFIWQKNFAPKNDAKYIANSHESIFCYAKNIGLFQRNLLPRTEEANQSYTNPDGDLRGVWTSTSMLATTFSQNYVFEITAPNGKKHLPPEGRCWRYSAEKIKELMADNRIWFGQEGNNVPRTKRFLTEVQQGIVPQSLLLYKEVGSGQDATNQLKKLFDNKQLFDFSKPVALIKHFLKIATAADQNDIILDFFAGSGTTAQAVLELNEEDGGNRTWICVQMPEPTEPQSEAYKAGYRTIAEVTKARIEKVIEKILQKKAFFQYFTLSESHFKIWRNEIQDKETLQKQILEHQKTEKPNATPDQLFVELCLKSGLGLNVPCRKEKGFYKTEKAWFCFETFTQALQNEVFTEKPEKVILLDSCFENEEERQKIRLKFEEIGIGLVVI